MEEAYKQRVDIIINTIHKKLTEKEQFLFGTLGAKNGIAGLSLFYFALYQYSGKKAYKDKGNDYLEQAFVLLNDGYLSGQLYRELAEIGWLIENISAAGLGLEDTNEVLDDFDAILVAMMREEIDKKNFDPVTGALAYGNYLLRRLDSQPSLKPVLQELIQFILEVAFENEKGIFWKSKLKDDDSIYLGITHGSANVILFLTYAKRKIPSLDIRETISKACQYILNNRQNHPYLLFPMVVGETYDRNVFAKHYCYGDYGTLYGLYRGYCFLGDEEKKSLCLSLFKEIYTRGHKPPFLVAGPSILYGSAGLAMIFKRFYAGYGTVIFENAYQEQIDELLSIFDPADQYLGYKGYWNQEFESTNLSLSEGIIGIGLTLMAHTNDRIRDLYEGFFYMRPF